MEQRIRGRTGRKVSVAGLGTWQLGKGVAWCARGSRRTTGLPPGVPYLSLHGTDPGGDYADWLADRIPTAVAEQAPKRTHYPHLAQPEWFVSRVHEFFTMI